MSISVIDIQNTIGSKLGIKWKHEGEKKRSADILQSLTEKKKYVIIFDDVWQQLPLSSIGIPNPKTYAHCCKVVFATRISAICKGADYTIKVECLSWGDSWTLFQYTVGKRLDVDPEIKNFSVKIVKECGGLPLALITAGQALASATASEWKEVARDMKEVPWRVPGMASNVFAVLRRSFDNLSSDTLKVCFLYFILYPKGTPIERKWFTDYWIGEGILLTNGVSMDEAHREGNRLIEQLEDAGLVVGDMDLHNMVRAMAVWIGTDTKKWLALTKAGIIQAPSAKKWELAERISLIDNEITAWPEEPHCPSLVTLLLWKGVFSRSFPEGFFKFMCSLKVLDLSWSYLDELPAAIGKLHMLQFLDISKSNIQSLPKEMGKLGRLIFLNLQKCQRLNIVPYGVFGGLTSLKVLRMDDTYSGWGLDVFGATIDELYNLKQLVEFDITIEDMAALQALVASPHLQASMRSVYLRHLKGTKIIQLPRDLGENMKILQWLRISDCSDLEELVFDDSDGEGSIENLCYLDIERLGKAKILWRGRGPRGCLRKLGELKITDCAKMEELVGGEDQVVVDDLEGPFAFPNLQLLYLIKLPSMESIYRVPLTFPSLRKLWVDNCPDLVKLPLGSNSAKRLSVIWGSKPWWDSLNWGLGGEVLKSNFEPFYVEW